MTRGILRLVAFCGLAVVGSTSLAQSTAFTYQGELKNSGQLASGLYDMRFRVYDSATGTNQIGSTVCVDNVTVTGGRFMAVIDFGQQFASQAARYLEMDVRADTGQTCTNSAGFTTLGPRQLITATPLATHAKSAFALDAPDGSPTSAVYVDNNGNVGIGSTLPQAPLHVVMPASGSAAIRIQGNSTTAANTAFLSFTNAVNTDIGYVGDGSVGDNSVFLGSYSGDVGLITPGGRVLTALADGSLRLGTSSADYRKFIIGGGNSEGYLYGSFARFGDGIHLGYNYYADAAGNNRVVNADGGTSRITASYGTILLATAPAFGGAPVDRLVIQPNGAITIPATVRVKSIHPATFVPSSLNADVGSGVGFEYITRQGITGYGFNNPFFAPVELPDGASVIGLAIDAIDGRATDISVTLYRTSLSTGNSDAMVQVGTTGVSTAIQHPSSNFVSFATIDNNAYSYVLEARLDSFGPELHRLIGARITYSVTTPLP